MRQVYFGTTAHAEWVACPRTDAGRDKVRYMEQIEYENSGADVVMSAPYRNEFSFEFPIQDASQSGMLEPWKRFYAGEYGLGPFYLFDPMYADYNLFGPQWAAPGLIEQDWKNFGAGMPSFSDTAANSYGLPPRRATWTIESAANTVDGQAFTFIVPSGYTLHLGGAGSQTGDGQLRYLPAGGAATTLTLASEASAPAFSATSTASSVQVYLTRTAANASTVSITALWAQILPTGQTPSLPRHYPGEGTSGLKFSNATTTESYVMADRHMIGMAVNLTEVGQWL